MVHLGVKRATVGTLRASDERKMAEREGFVRLRALRYGETSSCQ